MAVIVRFLLFTSLLLFGLFSGPDAGESASIPVTAEIIRPIGVTVVTLSELPPEAMPVGVKTKPSERHLELLLYPGRATESQVRFGGVRSMRTIRSLDGQPELLTDTLQVSDTLALITIIPISQ